MVDKENTRLNPSKCGKEKQGGDFNGGEGLFRSSGGKSLWDAAREIVTSREQGKFS